MKIVLHNDNNENNNNALLSIIKKGKVILSTVFNNAFLQNNEDFKEVEQNVIDQLPEEIKSELVDGKTYVLDFIDDSINAANSTKAAVESPEVKTIYKAIKDDAELVKDVVEFIRFAKKRREENKAKKESKKKTVKIEQNLLSEKTTTKGTQKKATAAPKTSPAPAKKASKKPAKKVKD